MFASIDRAASKWSARLPRWRGLLALSGWIMLASSLVSCSPTAVKLESVKFIVVRHAEKQTAENSGASFDANDPELTELGKTRAQNLARLLKRERIVAVYATPFKRTLTTAAPTAKSFALAVQRYEAKQDATAFTEQLRAQHQAGAVLIVGHSNTVPLMVAALCRCQAPELTDSDYGDRFEIVLHSGAQPDAQPALQQLQF
jgi:broad specificity phosphatase PhoE